MAKGEIAGILSRIMTEWGEGSGDLPVRRTLDIRSKVYPTIHNSFCLNKMYFLFSVPHILTNV